jgi:sugar/nucleoside kinase (ribokinase family)
MNRSRVVISGTGCALADFLYTDIRFDSAAFLKYLSRKAGDGGLSPGKLVFTEELERFAGRPYPEILKEITADRDPDSFNIGGPGLVSLIHVSQMLDSEGFDVRFYGSLGNDETSHKILSLVRKTPLDIDNYRIIGDKASPFTDVLSDPTYDHGHGERTFVNNIGSAWDYTSFYIDDDFFNSDIVCFGGTALVPRIHENLTSLLIKAKQNDCIAVVNTVYDFHNEKKSPEKNWPLGKSEESLRLIDVLIMDGEEAVRISGESSAETAAHYFIQKGVSTFIITNGAKDILAFSNGDLFSQCDLTRLPVSERVTSELRSAAVKKGDTTGCGDNFAGGVIASIAQQLRTRPRGGFDFNEALSRAIAAGGFTCFYKGGTYFEQSPGEKLSLVESYYRDYLDQLSEK